MKANQPIIRDFNSFLQSLSIPKACELNKPIYKKMLLDAFEGKTASLNATDKKFLKEDVDKIRWLYTLKPNTINIAPFYDNEREYPEVAVLHITLARPERFKRIAHFINRAIPYPLVLLFTCKIDNKVNVLISLADKRTNQADKEKWVIEDNIHTAWIDLAEQSEAESQFLKSLTISNLSFKHFFAFYQTLTDRVVGINCARHSGEFSLASGSDQEGENQDRFVLLKEIEKLDAQKSELANKLKKEKQMGRQVELNTQVKKINDKIAEIKGNL